MLSKDRMFNINYYLLLSNPNSLNICTTQCIDRLNVHCIGPKLSCLIPSYVRQYNLTKLYRYMVVFLLMGYGHSVAKFLHWTRVQHVLGIGFIIVKVALLLALEVTQNCTTYTPQSAKTSILKVLS